jgi:hypothetical protein
MSIISYSSPGENILFLEENEFKVNKKLASELPSLILKGCSTKYLDWGAAHLKFGTTISSGNNWM